MIVDDARDEGGVCYLLEPFSHLCSARGCEVAPGAVLGLHMLRQHGGHRDTIRPLWFGKMGWSALRDV